MEEAVLWEGTKHSGRWFPLVFLLEVLPYLKEEVMAFIKEFFARGKLSNNLCASFFALIPRRREPPN